MPRHGACTHMGGTERKCERRMPDGSTITKAECPVYVYSLSVSRRSAAPNTGVQHVHMRYLQTTWDRTAQLTRLIYFTTAGPIAGVDMTVDETTTYQMMNGFGASLIQSATLYVYLI
ncbi:hypothetical protein B0H17DRAFT_662772 [Mycena rosella]|uniref:Uncharacterized protein n=1 Tax=Mycena rosella TaxID=1033263 RepID=A0AAD7BC28_MYCRO|nr:hypothetical protein B0H17DRAFT_662772 [Mycena rosella]